MLDHRNESAIMRLRTRASLRGATPAEIERIALELPADPKAALRAPILAGKGREASQAYALRRECFCGGVCDPRDLRCERRCNVRGASNVA